MNIALSMQFFTAFLSSFGLRLKALAGNVSLSFVSEIFETLGDVVSGFASLLVTMFEAIVGVFWTEGADGTGEITFIGALLLFAAGTGLVIWGINYIRKLIRLRTKD